MQFDCRNLLQAGSSRPWPDILEEATGSRDLDASAIIEYFKPIIDYMDAELAKANEPKGWRSNFEQFVEGYTSIDNTVPIIVGAVLGAMVLIVIVAYFVGRSRNRKKHRNNATTADPEVGTTSADLPGTNKGAHDNAAYDRVADDEKDNPPPPVNPYVRQLPPEYSSPEEEKSSHDTPAESVVEPEKPTSTDVSVESEKTVVHEEIKKEDPIEAPAPVVTHEETVKEEATVEPVSIVAADKADEKETTNTVDQAEKPTEDKPTTE